MQTMSDKIDIIRRGVGQYDDGLEWVYGIDSVWAVIVLADIVDIVAS